ncbi:T9SS type A sorting domain-containing protein [candidate division KSB1 bacterium]|nr:T9SS type A sorting domain-containing protein [candidate division KSB1 bacterium]
MKNLALIITLSLFVAFVPNNVYTQFETKITPSDGETSESFGQSVSISGDYVIVGAPYDSDNGGLSGSAYIFKRNGTKWIEQTKFTASDGEASDRFGYSVAISGDYVVIGAVGDNDKGFRSGSAYIFKRNSDSWIEEAKLTASDGDAGDAFGVSVSINGDYTVVGALESDAKAIRSGSAYVFKREGTNWVEEAKLAADDGAFYDLFGYSVYISGDYVVVGAIYDNTNGFQCGSGYIFEWDDTNWEQHAKLTASDGAGDDYFGGSVSISGDYVVVGAYGDDDMGNHSGSAYIFKHDGTKWIEETKITASDGEEGDTFASSVCICGNKLLVGVHGDDDNGYESGSAYIFMHDGSKWIEVEKFAASDGDAGDYFGCSVSISGEYAVIGAFRDNDNGIHSGSAYIYNLSMISSTEILITIPSINTFPNDTIFIPIQIEFPSDKPYASAELSFSGYQNKLQFIEIDTTSSLVGEEGWTYAVNETDSLLLIACAGAQDIYGEGVFCWLKFKVIGETCTFVPLTIESALFNTGSDSVIKTDGKVFIKPIPFYGDVDENGLVQAHDAAFILKYLVGLIETLTCQQFYNADVTLDSTVSALDATVIMQYVVGLIDSLPYVPVPDQLIAVADVRMEDYVTSDQIVEIPIHLTGCDNVLAFEGHITYDPAHLTFTDVLWSSGLHDFTILDANTNGVLRIAGAGARPYREGEEFARVRFRMDQKSRASETIVALRQFRLNESEIQNNVAECHVALASDAETGAEPIPTAFSLEQNYPNPFNAGTTIQFALPHRTFVKLTVYDLLGREIALLVNEDVGAGVHKADFDADDMGSGLYCYRFETSEFMQTRKFLLLK